jgi:2-amino-4-hydroxy-6-hydroxymethyldihydropteridine diphosphokinase
MAKVILALGSNKGDKLTYIKEALKKIEQLGQISAVASLYQSSAYGITNQSDFYNSALVLNTEMAPEQLLTELKKIEKQVGRTKNIRWGPREIDLDIIFYDQKQIVKKELTIPHPDFQNRVFVLKPVAEIEPELPAPGMNMSMSDLLNKCEDKTIIEIVKKDWYSNGVTI